MAELEGRPGCRPGYASQVSSSRACLAAPSAGHCGWVNGGGTRWQRQLICHKLIMGSEEDRSPNWIDACCQSIGMHVFEKRGNPGWFKTSSTVPVVVRFGQWFQGQTFKIPIPVSVVIQPRYSAPGPSCNRVENNKTGRDKGLRFHQLMLTWQAEMVAEKWGFLPQFLEEVQPFSKIITNGIFSPEASSQSRRSARGNPNHLYRLRAPSMIKLSRRMLSRWI